MRVFGYARKIGSNGKPFPLTIKYALWPCKTISVCILPSCPKKTEEREKQQGREIAHQHWRARATWSTTKIAHQHRLVAPQHEWDRTPPWAPIHIQSTERNITQSPFQQTHTHLARSTPTWSRAAWNTTEIAPMTHPCPISLFLDLPLPFPHLSITLSSSFSSFDWVFELWKCFVLIFVWFCFDFCLF